MQVESTHPQKDLDSSNKGRKEWVNGEHLTWNVGVVKSTPSPQVH